MNDPETLATLSYCEVSTRESPGRMAANRGAEVVLAPIQLGDEINGRYLLCSLLGQGGMGQVFLARDKTLDRNVALKIVALRKQESPTDSSHTSRDLALAREAKLAAQLNHPGIASVYDFGVHAARYFTIFEYVCGQTLRQKLQDQVILPLNEVQQLASELAEALDYAHSEGVVHRDLKPENICIAENGVPKILDFGIARDLKSDFDAITFRGTPAYAAPEQAACRPADRRADQYALAAIVFEMLTGRRPIEAPNPLSMLLMKQEKDPVELSHYRPDIPPGVEAAVMQALAREPSERFACCKEFVAAMSLDVAGVERWRVPGARTNESTAWAVHLSHIGSDSLVARKLSRSLDERGFLNWYYQRDALPGIPLARQTRESIERSAAVMLLISRESLAADEFIQEIRATYRLGRHSIPVLVDLSLEEFESYQPMWRSLLGTAALIEYRRGELQSLVDRVCAALAQWNIGTNLPAGLAQPSPRRHPGQVWATDANQIEIHELSRIVFRNGIINDFLEKRNKYFLSATKGLGKTLLLTYKRHHVTQHQGDSDGSLCLVPQGRPFLDFMSEMRSLSARYAKPLSELSTCKRLWGAAIRISTLSHHSHVMCSSHDSEIEAFPARVQRWLRGAKIEPTVVFKELTTLPVSQVNCLIDDTENFLDEQIRHIHSSTYFFIDKVDQAVRNLPRPAWINMQAGLIEAAWDLMNANSHLKIFATIRHEAFANYESDIKMNLLGATTILRYSEPELHQMMDQLANCYEQSSTFQDFVGVNVIKDAQRPFPEDSFLFLRRHTFGRPRDLVAIASDLSASKELLGETNFCDIVRNTAASALVANIFEETRVFLDCLADKETRLRFFAQIETNILTRMEAIAQSARFNGLSDDHLWHFDADSTEIYHPLRDLYLGGLLGYVAHDPDSERAFQVFRQPSDSLDDCSFHLPESTHYFLHPALSEYIRQHRTTEVFQKIKHVLVGEYADWQPYDATLCEIERRMRMISDRAIRKSVNTLLTHAVTVLRSSLPKNLRAEFASLPIWLQTREHLMLQGSDELVFWIEELFV